jgi:hypothetical protein
MSIIIIDEPTSAAKGKKQIKKMKLDRSEYRHDRGAELFLI